MRNGISLERTEGGEKVMKCEVDWIGLGKSYSAGQHPSLARAGPGSRKAAAEPRGLQELREVRS